MKERDDDDDLRGLLESPAAMIADDGFTDGVLAKLPPPRRHNRRSFVLGTSIASAALVLWLSPARGYLSESIVRAIATERGSTPVSVLLTIFVLIATMVCAGAYATTPE